MTAPSSRPVAGWKPATGGSRPNSRRSTRRLRTHARRRFGRPREDGSSDPRDVVVEAALASDYRAIRASSPLGPDDVLMVIPSLSAAIFVPWTRAAIFLNATSRA